MQSTALQFKRNVREALADQQLQDAMGFAKSGFVAKRAALVETVPEWQAIREQARDVPGGAGLVEMYRPCGFLRDFHLVELPGTESGSEAIAVASSRRSAPDTARETR